MHLITHTPSKASKSDTPRMSEAKLTGQARENALPALIWPQANVGIVASAAQIHFLHSTITG